MHGQENALLFWHEELLGVLQVVHIPQLYLTIRRGSGHLVVLVKRVHLVLLLFDGELTWRNVFELRRANRMLGIMAVLQPQGYALDPAEVPHRARGRKHYCLVAGVVVAGRLDVPIDREGRLHSHEKVVWVVG